MGRSIVNAQAPILGSIFRNTNSPTNLRLADGSWFKALPITYPNPDALINTIDQPIAASTYQIGNFYVSYGRYVEGTAFDVFQLNTSNVDNLILTWCVNLAQGASAFQSNKTENFVSQSREINGNFIGHFNQGWGGYNFSRFGRVNVSNGVVTGGDLIGYADCGAYYYDSANSKHVWISNGSKYQTSDGLAFTTTTVSGLTAREYNRAVFGIRPFVAVSGNNGIYLQRNNSTANAGTDGIQAWRTTDNFATVTSLTTLIPGGTTYGIPHIVNYDGTKLFVLSGGADGSSSNMSGRFTSDFGATMGTTTVSGDAIVFHGMSGRGANFSGVGASHLASCSGANASSFMYLSSSYGNYFAYYTSNGGQSFTAKDVSSLVSGLGSNGDKDGFVALSYANGVWVALFQKQLFGIYSMKSSDNGTTWTSPVLVFSPDGNPSEGGYYLSQILTHSNQFVAFKMSSNRIRFAKSSDGITWTAMNDPNFSLGYSNCYVEFDNHFIVGGKVIRKSDLTIVGHHAAPGYTSSGARLATLAVPNNKMVTAFASWGGAVVADAQITNSVKTMPLFPQNNSYSTSGSVYGAFEYVRVL
jgi:hypothetical protein